MSGIDNKKSKRRKVKKITVTKAATQIRGSTPEDRPTSVDGEALKNLEKLMDAQDDESALRMTSFSRGKNPFLDQERCLLCNCQRQDPPEAEKILSETINSNEQTSETNPLSQLPLWVCPACRKAADQEIEKKPSLEHFLEQDFDDSFLPDISIKPGSEPTTPNGTLCACEACTERRVIEDEHEQETQDLQFSWMELRKVVRHLYGNRDNSNSCDKETSNAKHVEEEKVKELVHKLHMRDPHQLFLRLESQVREFVIEMKVKLLKQLSTGFKTPPQAKKFISMLLEEYTHLCTVARKMAGLLKELQDHLKRFKVTWDLHNKHLFQSIVFSEPSIKNSMTLLLTQLRLGAASKESYNEDTYPNLLHRYLKFDDEMSVINVVWRDCHQLIESYNEEQSALKLKQKMLREDWEFFKTQRKLLEQQVSKNSKSCTHNLEAQFTETMRLMLQGNKPSQDELLCPRCNRKRCPCDECTITHMITCGIINPEVLENTNAPVNTHHNAPFMHDPNRYRIDVSPPSMSSTTSSSGSSSPIMVDPDRRAHPFIGNLNEDENQEENDNQSFDDDDDEEDDGDDEIDDDDEEEEDDVDEEEDEEDNEEFTEMKEDLESESNPFKLEDFTIKEDGILFGPDSTKMDTCNCDHCVSQARQAMKVEENPCQCHVCLKQQGKDISTSLPQPVPPIVPKPGELHLYPHIHGSTGLHTLGRGHVRPILQPNLYDLHLPSSQRHKPIIQQTKVPIKLDFDSAEGINDHIYHAYGDWDNTTCDPRLLFGSGKLESELLPPPPFSSPYTSNLLTEPFSIAGALGTNATPVISSVSASSAFTSTVSNHTTTSTVQAASKITDNLSVLTIKETLGEHLARNSKCTNLDMSSKNHTPPCTRPATLGGNNVPKLSQKGHSQHCSKHNPQANVKTGTLPNHNHGGQLPMKMDLIKEGRQMVQQFANTLKHPNSHSTTCNHNKNNNNNRSHAHINGGIGPGDPRLPMSECSGSVQLPTTVNNVSVGTSTLCTEPDCDGNHDDNYDSIDDNCSEQSSSTSNSTSNQKDGKYCDCCYCEFFGHQNSQVAPTSKNYPEMRDKLRLRLKKKQTETKSAEQQQDEDVALGTKGLDELIEYINGTDTGKKVNSKAAAKRARQKLKKEKAKLEAEQEQKKEQALREAELICLRELSNKEAKKQEVCKRKEKEIMEASQTKSLSPTFQDRSKKKKSKHKEEEGENLQVRITCEIEHESDALPTVPSNKPLKSSPSYHNCSNHSASLACFEAAWDQQFMLRPSPQGSSAPIVPVTIDNRVVINNKTNKNKEPKRNSELQNGESRSNAKNLQSQQIPLNVKQFIAQNEKMKKGNNKNNPNDRPVLATERYGPTPSIIDLQEMHAASMKSSQAQSPRSQERNNNKQSQKASQVNNTSGQNVSQQPQSQSQQGNKKGKKGNDSSQSAQPSPPTSRQTLPQHTNNLSSTSVSFTATPVLQNGIQSEAKPPEKTRQQPQGQSKSGSGTPASQRKNPADQGKDRQGSPPTEQGKTQASKAKKKKMKKKGTDDIEFIDEVFMPKSMDDLDKGDMDESEREIELFKRFCANSLTPVKREKLQVNVNIRDIFDRKKKNLLSCN